MYEKSVREFHQQFGQDAPPTPCVQPESVRLLRVNLMDEELCELEDALLAKDLVGIADACADLIYVVVGTAIAYGIPIDKCFKEVHRSNMTKLWPADSDGPAGVRYRADGKVLKPPTYSKADIKSILIAASRRHQRIGDCVEVF